MLSRHVCSICMYTITDDVTSLRQTIPARIMHAAKKTHCFAICGIESPSRVYTESQLLSKSL